jgi:hypothetical protein
MALENVLFSSESRQENCTDCFLSSLLISSSNTVSNTVSKFMKLFFILNPQRLYLCAFHLANHQHFVLWKKFNIQSEISIKFPFFQLKWKPAWSVGLDSLARHHASFTNITLQSNRLKLILVHSVRGVQRRCPYKTFIFRLELGGIPVA